MNTETMVRNYTGSIKGYNELTTALRTEKEIALKCAILNTPSHHRRKVFGEDVLRAVGLLDTCREYKITKKGGF